MSDTRLYYEQLRGRARQLVDRLDDTMNDLVLVESAVEEVMRADMDNPGELSTTDAADLRQLLDATLFSVRAAERIAVEHVNDVDRAMRRLGLSTEKTAV
ncbi:hypothetical protein LWP59_30435 [Amycolatopsis acidiphila]|uniref:Uncharacterized protein n=1 Tax=Amycolatopsis acidiphila TaxID=715473 RepID=A0A557ZRA4_9PSEU|nr:hypothetical protein [Amycolatopsis acidiphila]TVT14502.1 hypothetical protein FNH06_37645 [Amycolatopsis acidiphila]UIJ58401.1 hypothetical protein LWP59_30435 [Amycolatopsis acidiphila]GHG93490.1 hypothetical protein GCM10017788_70900 [Amycolatopsis acidiphila]